MGVSVYPNQMGLLSLWWCRYISHSFLTLFFFCFGFARLDVFVVVPALPWGSSIIMYTDRREWSLRRSRNAIQRNECHGRHRRYRVRSVKSRTRGYKSPSSKDGIDKYEKCWRPWVILSRNCIVWPLPEFD